MSHPVSQAIRAEKLSFFDSESFTENSRFLSRVYLLFSSKILQYVRKVARNTYPVHDWKSHREVLRRVFSLDHSHHLFHASPINWARFTEPQLTKGLGYFLSVRDLRVRHERIKAALLAFGANPSGGFNCASVAAEVETNEKTRIDLLITWKGDDEQTQALVVEAKINHVVTKGQLQSYRRHLKNFDKGLSRLVVVSPKPTGPLKIALSQNPEWCWVSWRDFLLRHERLFSSWADDPHYVQFRRTLWEQT